MKPIQSSMRLVFITLALFAGAHPAAAQGTTAFTYQGQLRDGGTNANGAYTMTFKLYDAASGGNQIGGNVTTSATLVNGLFTVNLDFGADAFNGSARWLDITVLDENLAPRVQVLPSPYALHSVSAESAANLSGGTWNAAAGNFEGHTNVFGIFNNGSVMLGMSSDGSMINGNFEVTGDLNVDGSFSPGSLSLNNGGSISGDGHGGFNFNGLVENLSADTLSANNLMANNLSLGNLSVSNNLSANDLNITSGSFTLGAYPDWSFIYSDGTGGLNVEAAGVGQTDINPSGINTTGEINVNSGTVLIYPNGDIHANWFDGLGVNATIGCTAPYFNTTSDRNAKEQFTPVDSLEILEQVVSLPISRWNFKTAEKTRHIGPMAQDFYAAFKVGTDDKHIATVDEEGVALAAIQGLNQKLNEKDAEIRNLEKRLADLEQTVKSTAQK